MKRRGGVSPFALILIVLLIGAILLIGVAALANQQNYRRQAAITPTPSITPRTVLVTAEPGQPTWSPTPALLQVNSVGVEVKQLQTRLQALGYYSGTLDGEFGSGTRAAVEAFQRQHGLKADGIAGDETLRLLYSEQATAFVATPTPAAIAVLSGSLPMLVNKQNPVSADFVPSDLVDMSAYCDSGLVKIKHSGTQGVREAVDALMVMLSAARDDGVTNWQVSAAYRSYADQERIFNDYVSDYMKTKNLNRTQAISATRLTVADPGTSEHHTGLAFDMTVPGASTFAGTKQCAWLHEHCWEYGFIIRYTDEKQDITGFLGEEWHIRYVGREHSLNMRDSGLCLEEYLQYATLQ